MTDDNTTTPIITPTSNNPTIPTPKLTKREIALKNLSKVNMLERSKKGKGGRKPIVRDAGKSMKIWAKMYLESSESVQDFEKWRKLKPHEALTWAYKAVYGDGNDKTEQINKGQVNVLISILTGKTAINISQSSSNLTQLPQVKANPLPLNAEPIDNIDSDNNSKT